MVDTTCLLAVTLILDRCTCWTVVMGLIDFDNALRARMQGSTAREEVNAMWWLSSAAYSSGVTRAIINNKR